jgi:crotonobetainyl-CoA:carnitine CoA-transferase CaiB-like acyl-CoA transferase
MARIEESVEIKRPVDKVFAYTTEAKSFPKWQSTIPEAEQTSQGPVCVGTTFKGRDPKFADTVSRLRNVEELDKLVEKWTIERDPTEVMTTLQAAGIAAGMAQRAADTINDPHVKWTKALIELDHPVAGKRLYPNIPFRMSNTTLPPSTPAPLLGQHTEEICRELLRMSAEEIQRLEEEKVLDIA